MMESAGSDVPDSRCSCIDGEKGCSGPDEDPSIARASVFLKTDLKCEDQNLLLDPVQGYNFNRGIDYHDLLVSYRTTGFQATNLATAVDIVNCMLSSRKVQFDEDTLTEDEFIRRKSGCTIFLGCTSNIASSGLRDVIRFLVQHRMVDCIVTTGGGIDADLIKCFSPSYIGDFDINGGCLIDSGFKKVGNLLIPGDNLDQFEKWIVPILGEISNEKTADHDWTPSELITRLGERINNEESICYWAARNKIPIFCPTLVLDGYIGNIVTDLSDLDLDVTRDIVRINSIHFNAQNTGMIIIGGGVIKHHICNANLMRNGADYAVYINTAAEFDGSDSGASPDEAVSWGKIRSDAKSVKICCEASIIFPLLVAETFARQIETISGVSSSRFGKVGYPSIESALVSLRNHLKNRNQNLILSEVHGYDFNRGIDYHEILKSFSTTGLQATNVATAIDVINCMLTFRREKIEVDCSTGSPLVRRESVCTIFLGYTSNIVSSGLRDIIRFLVQHKMVDCIVTTGGGIEEDLIKCLDPTFIGDFNLKGSYLRDRGVNRIGNLLIPNDNYGKFEDWITPILNEMLEEQEKGICSWTPSKLIARLGERINNEESICYWAAQNKIPIFCPGITDGSIGDMIFFHSLKKIYDKLTPLRMGTVEDARSLKSIAAGASKSGLLIIGGGVIKHHICEANKKRGGADYSVLINTAHEFDGSDAGLSPDSSLSWGHLKPDSKSVKIACEATIVLPLIVAETFAQHLVNSKRLPNLD